MKSIPHVVHWLVPAVLAIIRLSTALSCFHPVAESIALTWPPVREGIRHWQRHQLLISPDRVFDASLVPGTWRECFVDSTGVMSKVPGESGNRRS
jgi:hypothetical protein